MKAILYILIFYVILNFVFSLFYAIPPMYLLIGFIAMIGMNIYRRRRVMNAYRQRMQQATQAQSFTHQTPTNVVDVEFKTRKEEIID